MVLEILRKKNHYHNFNPNIINISAALLKLSMSMSHTECQYDESARDVINTLVTMVRSKTAI